MKVRTCVNMTAVEISIDDGSIRLKVEPFPDRAATLLPNAALFDKR